MEWAEPVWAGRGRGEKSSCPRLRGALGAGAVTLVRWEPQGSGLWEAREPEEGLVPSSVGEKAQALLRTKRKMKRPHPCPQKNRSVALSGASLACVCAFSGSGPEVLKTGLRGLWMPL